MIFMETRKEERFLLIIKPFTPLTLLSQRNEWLLEFLEK
jgi:hypothetical protein